MQQPVYFTAWQPYRDEYGYLRQYPPVTTNVFMDSAASFQSLLQDAGILLDRISHSTAFAQQLMTAAQENKKDAVQRLVRSTGVRHLATTVYNPDSLTVTFNHPEKGCCQLILRIRWH